METTGHSHISSKLWRNLFMLVMNGEIVAPRELQTREACFSTTVIPPYPFQAFKERKLDFDYLRREFQWYLGGNPYDLRIADHAMLWKKHINPDNTLNSNYGYYLVRNDGILKAVRQLHDDPLSRQAVCTIFNSHEHLKEGVKDIPCTSTMSFLIRGGSLHMHIHMRSNDLVFGLGNDAPCFHWFHQIAWHCLRERYPDLKFGSYIHTTNSLHIYARHFDLANLIIREEAEWEPVEVPVIESTHEAIQLLQGEHIDAPFSNWLFEVSL